MVHAVKHSWGSYQITEDLARSVKTQVFPRHPFTYSAGTKPKRELVEESLPNYLSEVSLIEAESNGWKASKSYVLSQVCKITSYLEPTSFGNRKIQSLHTFWMQGWTRSGSRCPLGHSVSDAWLLWWNLPSDWGIQKRRAPKSWRQAAV